jgi:beta-glucosidase
VRKLGSVRGATPQQLEERIEAVLSELSLEEKVAMLSGHGFMEQIAKDGGRYCARLYHIGAGNKRLGIPPLFFNDGPRGVAMGSSTCFPVPMARGASFDTELEERVGDAIGRELRAHGGNLFGGVCINLLRHPAWGRAQETYGEDPFLLGKMGAALTRGVQHHNVVATPKHYAANSMENARFEVDVSIDERALREVYLPHFKRCIDAGAGAVMSAYNQVNGAYCGHNPVLLTDILKNEWGFDGFVYSDFVLGCRGADASAAGLDVEAPDTIHFGAKLVEAVERGEVSDDRINDAVRRVLRSLLRTLVAPDPERYSRRAVASKAHRTLAREAAAKSIVLLKNDSALPFAPASLRGLLVVGKLASDANLGDHGSSRVYPPDVITPYEGLRAACPPDCEVTFDAGDDEGRVRTLAIEADAVLVVAGYTHEDEGEFIPGQMVDLSGDEARSIGGDRLDLSLGAEQESLIRAVAAANPNTVVALMAGSALTMESWRDHVAGILMLWYPGMEGGAALADVIFGHSNPSGHLPFTIPKSAEDLPFFDRDAKAITYDLWHGYTKLERDKVQPAFAFGFGLSYTTFEFSNASATLDTKGETLQVEVDVTNTGEREGDTVVQVYAGWATPAPEQPRKRLCGFVRTGLSAGESKRVAVDVAARDLAWFDVGSRCWRLGESNWRIHVGPSSDEAAGTATTVAIPEQTWTIRDR